MTAPETRGGAGERLGVFGGSFNPPHVGHLAVAEAVAEAADLDHVLWVPARIPPHKKDHSDLEAPEARLDMVRAATRGNEYFRVSDVEIRRKGPSFTADTLHDLRLASQKASFFLIMGEDSLETFPRWSRPHEITERADLLVYRRPGAEGREVPNWLAPHVRFVEGPLIDLSSTALRDCLRAGKTVRYLVPDAVRQIIAERDLYVSPETDETLGSIPTS